MFKTMKKGLFLLGMTTAVVFNANVYAENTMNLPDLTQPINQNVKGMLLNLLQDNDSFVKANGISHFEGFLVKQHPRATVISCCDSRVQMLAMDKTPEDDLFIIRNIGNQLKSVEGSVEYGVHHLKTPLLVVIGHTGCGAVAAASGDYATLSPTIKKELDTLQVAKVNENDSEKDQKMFVNIQTNVKAQVKQSVEKFKEEVEKGELTVVGAVYDFHNKFGKGYGTLNFISVNGIEDQAAVQAFIASAQK
ncbi:MAG: carbonic anhydrase [Chlamydiales bacterium]|nr:carbonic anhydrase [Chlamydiales bacterium]